MSSSQVAAASPVAEAEKPKDSKHKKEKKDKSESQRKSEHKHGHSKKTKTSDSTSAAAAEQEDEDWEENRAAVERLCAQYPNNVCCDCGESGTRWASVNHGVFVCIRCSGVHRSLGTHVSKVKSTNMDRWSLAEVRLMEAVGNAKGKTLYEARLPAGTRPQAGSGSVADAALKSFIQRKYVDREFAMHNLKDVLGRLYRDTGYGRPPKKPSKSADGATTKSSVEREAKAVPDRATMAGQRGDTMRALYGDAASELQRGAAAKRKKGRAGEEANGADAQASQPTYGAFGLVNVPAAEYDQRWQRTLAAFHHVEGTSPAAEPAQPSPPPLQQEEKAEVSVEEGEASAAQPSDAPTESADGPSAAADNDVAEGGNGEAPSL